MRLSKLTKELALALEIASVAQAWGNPSPFQDKINELLVRAGRKPVAPARLRRKNKMDDAGCEMSCDKSHAKT